MKKFAFISLGVALLVGCSTQSMDWQQDQPVTISEATVTLKSTLWVDMMPSIGEGQDNTLHGSLLLDSEQGLTPTINVEVVSIQQGEQVWLIEGEAVELRTHSPNQWEVAFEWQVPLDPEQPVDLALQLSDQGKKAWVVNKQVAIDKIY